MFRFYHNDSLEWDYDEVEEWFIFDWCSIPICILWQKVEPKTITPCCYHDRLFKKKKYWFFKSNYLFLKSLKVNWVSICKRSRYYLWVTLFWWIKRYFN